MSTSRETPCICICIYVCVCVCVCIYIYIYIYIYILQHKTVYQIKQKEPDSQGSQGTPELWVSCGTCFISLLRCLEFSSSSQIFRKFVDPGLTNCQTSYICKVSREFLFSPQ